MVVWTSRLLRAREAADAAGATAWTPPLPATRRDGSRVIAEVVVAALPRVSPLATAMPAASAACAGSDKTIAATAAAIDVEQRTDFMRRSWRAARPKRPALACRGKPCAFPSGLQRGLK